MQPTSPHSTLQRHRSGRRTHRFTLIRPRGALLLCLLVLLVPCAVPAIAAADTPPVITAPSAAANAVEGGTVEVHWKGDLQGDADAMSRSFFRVQIAPAAGLPAGQQADWDAVVELENATQPGEVATTLSVGVPSPGAYKLRVCAWGVVDDVAQNSIQQMPSGCSLARDLTATAAKAQQHSIGEITKQNKVIERAAPVTVVREQEAPASSEPVVSDPEPSVVETAPDPVQPVAQPTRTVTSPKVMKPLLPAVFETGETEDPASSVTHIGDTGLEVGTGVAEQARSVFTRVLSASLPGLPIPFWSLLVLFVCIPIARAWRTSVMSMFGWTGDVEPGKTPVGDLQIASHDNSFKDRGATADAEASAAGAPDKHRAA